MKHRLLRVVQRLFQYQVLLTGRPHRRSMGIEVAGQGRPLRRGGGDCGDLTSDHGRQVLGKGGVCHHLSL